MNNNPTGRWQDVPEIATLREELFSLSGSSSLAGNILGKGYYLNDKDEKPGRFIEPSDKNKRIEWLKVEIMRLRNEFIMAGLRGE